MGKLYLYEHIPGGRKLAKWREEAGLTQFQLAERTGITPTTICKYETGLGLPHTTATCALIQQVTNGEVAVSDWIDWTAIEAEIAKRMPS